MPTSLPERSRPARPAPVRRGSWWWQLAVAALVAPFYVGLYLITAIGAAFDRR